ncbi:MAG: transcription elongation factor GreA [Clostridia bacterium]
MEVLMTADGKKELEARLDYLITVRRAEVSEQIKVARGFGDLSENAEYDAAKDAQAQVEGEIAEIQAKLVIAKIINEVEVNVYDTSKDKEVLYHIVGSEEVDLKLNRISNESPVGRDLINAKKGQEVRVSLPNGTTKILKVLSIKR